MKSYRLVIYSSLALALFTTQSCKNNGHEKFQDDEVNHAAYFQKVSKINTSINGKNIDFLDSLINTKPFTEEVLLLISTKNDCISCVEKGSKSLQDYKIKPNSPPTLEIHFKPDKVKIKFELEDFLLDNKNGFAHDFEVFISKYPTPILMLYQESKGIKKIYCIPTFDDEERRNDFLNGKN